jgi:hypothetical protein
MTTTSDARKLSGLLPSRPVALAFLVGLLGGPVLAGYAGLTVSAGTAETRLREGTRALEAALCEARARAEADPSKLTQAARRDLAAKHSVVRSDGMTDPEIADLCRARLTT